MNDKYRLEKCVEEYRMFVNVVYCPLIGDSLSNVFYFTCNKLSRKINITKLSFQFYKWFLSNAWIAI